MARQGAMEQAIPLYLTLGDSGSAANAILTSADSLIEAGCWATVDAWLSSLPAAKIPSEPGLLRLTAQMAAARGQTESAQRQFAAAAAEYAAREQPYEASRCQMAESELALRERDTATAQARALAAQATAEAAGDEDLRARAMWQLARLATVEDDLATALGFLRQTGQLAHEAGDADLQALVVQAEGLILDARALRQERDVQRQVLVATEQAVRHAAQRLQRLAALGAVSPWVPPPAPDWPVPRADGGEMAADVGDSQVATGESPGGAGSIWSSWLQRVRMLRSGPNKRAEPIATPRSSLAAPTTAPLATTDTRGGPHVFPLAGPPVLAWTLAAYMLGPFRVAVDGQAVASWPSGKGKAVIKYLLAHRSQPVLREVLMDTFWPNSSPEAARNSLNVALHGLRQALHEVSALSVVVYEAGAYRLHDDLVVWLDSEEFERHVGAGRRLVAAAELEAAMAEYDQAVMLYEGDYLAEDPYEEWPQLTRDHLRLMYLDVLDRQSEIYMDWAQYSLCVQTCKRLLTADGCHESAHRRLMRCYSRNRQAHLALRQYQVCAESLRRELAVEPDAQTAAIHERIRRHEPV